MSPWECPRCHRINAGWVAYCDCKIDEVRHQPFTQAWRNKWNASEDAKNRRSTRILKWLVK